MPAQLTDHFATLAPHYDAVLSDVWGVIHNGVTSFPAACDALRPGEQVIRLLDHLHVPRDTFDGIMTSGDVTRAIVAQRAGQRVFLIGPERDHTIFTGLDAPFSSAEDAAYVVCTGLFDDEVETPEDYAPLLAQLRGRNLFMVCANPDVVVERGDRLIYCAGALADAYQALGGEVYYAGKPHRPLSRPRWRCRACSRSAIRCAPTSRARTISGSIACSSPPGSMPRSSATATIRISIRWARFLARPVTPRRR